MRTRYGVSPWVDSFPASRRPDYPRLRGEHDVSVAVVGGGLTGCATAYACAVAGMKPVILEAGRIGQGSSGRGAGVLLPEPGPPFIDLQRAHGLRAARRIFESWRRASLDAAALLRRLGIRCDLTACDGLAIARRDDGKGLRREQQARGDAGLDARWMNAAAVVKAAAIDGAGGLRVGGCFAFDPYRATLGLAAAAARRGVLIHERTHARRIRARSKDVEIVTEGGVVRARTVIVCTGSATAEFAPLRRHFKRREQYLVMTEPVPAAIRRQLGRPGTIITDTARPPYGIRWTADSRVIVSGADQGETPDRTRDRVLVQRTGQLMYELLLMNPAISGLHAEYGWECGYGQTADGVMYIGPHRNYPRHLFALGSGSMAGAFLAARLLSRAAAGAADKGDEVFGWTR
jgi:glycine/D-amino acid oxidase-like deaminating enzyme